MRTFTSDRLRVTAFDDDGTLGAQAAADFAAAVRRELAAHDEAAVILALGAAQDAFFASLKTRDDIEWGRLTVLHVDTYVGVAASRTESGASRLRRHLLDAVGPKDFLPMLGDTQPIEDEMARYARLLADLAPQVCVVGIGETGHLAFNDPPADFGTPAAMDIVELAEQTREQILRAGIFPTLPEVPTHGLTMTMPALMRPATVLALVHEPEKADAVATMLTGPISGDCPASLLRTHPDAHLMVGPGAAARIV